MRVLFATAELRPLVSTGGLGEAASGLSAALRAAGVEVITALPAYRHWDLEEHRSFEVAVPVWDRPATVRLGDHPEGGRLALVDGPGIARPNPYVDEQGEGWEDNDRRFAGFSAAVAALGAELDVDVVHLNDWHTALHPAFATDDRPTVLTIHNLAHQGWAPPWWLDLLPSRRDAYRRGDALNALAGGIRLADRIVAVSPTYAREIATVDGGMGLHDTLAERADAVTGILNGIDTRAWDPAIDPHVPTFDADHIGDKAAARRALLQRVGWDDDGSPLIVMITRLVDQKGVDLAFEAARYLPGMRARLVILGSGEAGLARWGHELAAADPDRIWFHEGYDGPLSHLLFAGGDVLAMPSRFEPCGLAQMQAMAYGTLPVATPVGGLCDTVIDADRHPDGNGFLTAGLDVAGLVDGLHRALRAVRDEPRRRAIQGRGMRRDWSWTEPARHYLDLYVDLGAGRP